MTAAELVQLIAFTPRQAYILQGTTGALGNLLRLKAVVQQRKGNLLPRSEGYQLAFVVLHNEAHTHSDIGYTLILCAFAMHQHITAIATTHVIGHNACHSLAQGGFAGTARAGDSSEAALFDIKIDILKHQIGAFIGKVKII